MPTASRGQFINRSGPASTFKESKFRMVKVAVKGSKVPSHKVSTIPIIKVSLPSAIPSKKGLMLMVTVVWLGAKFISGAMAWKSCPLLAVPVI